MIYYPVGMHHQNAYKTNASLSVSDSLCESVLSIPMHTELTEEQQQFIAESIKEFYSK
jgi:dTDP-4-amino-4,6-dideoxygalactose transaminase